MDASLQAPEKDNTLCPLENCPVDDRFDLILKELAHIRRAFPENEFGEPDILGHRRAHDAQIEAKEAEKAFWIGLRNELIRRGAYFLILTLAGILATGILVRFRAVILRIVDSR